MESERDRWRDGERGWREKGRERERDNFSI